MSQNPSINPNIYQPKNFNISNIEKSSHQTLITTTEDYDYVLGQLVRIHVPFPYGMRQIDGKAAYIIGLNSATQFTCDLDSSSFDDFIEDPVYPGNIPAQVTAIGDRNNSTDDLTISGAFQQI